MTKKTLSDIKLRPEQSERELLLIAEKSLHKKARIFQNSKKVFGRAG